MCPRAYRIGAGEALKFQRSGNTGAAALPAMISLEAGSALSVGLGLGGVAALAGTVRL
jgi:hypothetical protein